MKKLQTFWHALRHSVIPLDAYYHKVRRTHLSFSIKYFISLIVSVIVVTTLLKVGMVVQKFPPSELSTLLKSVETDYPDSLVLNINDMGRLSTNYDKPYILFSPLESNPIPLVVVDTRASKNKIFEYNTTALFAERYLAIRINNHVYTLFYELNAPLRVDKSDILSITRNAHSFLDSYWVWVVALTTALILIAIPVLFVIHTITLLIISAVTYIFVKLLVKRATCTYTKIFQVSLHTVTAPIIIQAFLFISNQTVNAPYWYIILNYIFLAGGVYEAFFEKTPSRKERKGNHR